MIKAIESNLYRVSKSDNYTEPAYVITVKDTSNNIVVFKEELTELIQLLTKADDML